MTPPYFSICIPNYNYGGFIGKTIESVLAQEYQNFEVIIVDNASTDNSWEVISAYVNKDERVKAYRNEYNVGFAPNLDRAAQKANFDFIIMLSSDDLMHPNALLEYSNILSQLGENAAKFILTSAIDIIDQDDKLIRKQFRDEYHNVEPSLKYRELQNELVSVHDGLKVFQQVFPKMGTAGPFCATMFSREIYNKVSGYGSVNLIGPDAHFVYKAMLCEVPLIFVNKTLFSYRIHNNSQLSQTQKNLNINILIDRYLFTNYYSELQLNSAGIKREDAVRQIFDEACFKTGFREIQNGRYQYAFRHLCFAFAAYPKIAAGNYKSYLLFVGILLGPITRACLNVFRKIK